MTIDKQQVEALYIDFINSFNKGAAKTVEHFDETALIEYPYSPNENNRKMNKEAYFNQLTNALKNMGTFTIHNYSLYATDVVGTYWATLNAECPIPATGKIFSQNYVQRFTVNEKLKFTHYMEYGNPLKFKEAMS